jgi:hypothetical protein
VPATAAENPLVELFTSPVTLGISLSMVFLDDIFFYFVATIQLYLIFLLIVVWFGFALE